ncbi:unnamed protein product, partial [Gadus morhua 'NCC']
PRRTNLMWSQERPRRKRRNNVQVSGVSLLRALSTALLVEESFIFAARSPMYFLFPLYDLNPSGSADPSESRLAGIFFDLGFFEDVLPE